MRKRQDFFIVVVDHDNKVFAVEGPRNSSNVYTMRVDKLKNEGRNVMCYVSNALSRQVAIQNFKCKNEGYTYTDESIV